MHSWGIKQYVGSKTRSSLDAKRFVMSMCLTACIRTDALQPQLDARRERMLRYDAPHGTKEDSSRKGGKEVALLEHEPCAATGRW